jgi:hypothetical protein
MKYRVERVERTEYRWGWSLVAVIRRSDDGTLYIIGPAHSELELLQRVLERFGK